MRRTLVETCLDLGFKPGHIPTIAANVVAPYKDKERHYTHLVYIANGIELLSIIPVDERLRAIVEFAWWLHGILFIPMLSDSASKSADYALEILKRELIQQDTQQLVRSLILATAHENPPQSALEAIISDVHLNYLSTPWVLYQSRVEALRREFSSAAKEMLILPGFSKGRRLFIETLLSWPKIYYTKEFAELEPLARRNLGKELGEIPTI